MHVHDALQTCWDIDLVNLVWREYLIKYELLCTLDF